MQMHMSFHTGLMQCEIRKNNINVTRACKPHGTVKREISLLYEIQWANPSFIVIEAKGLCHYTLVIPYTVEIE